MTANIVNYYVRFFVNILKSEFNIVRFIFPGVRFEISRNRSGNLRFGC